MNYTTMQHRIDSSLLDKDEMKAMESLVKSGQLPALIDDEGNHIKLPKPIFELLVHLVQQMKQGHSVVMMPEDETFSTQAAANYLGVSRQHFVNRLEDGEIPFHKVGSHRRVYFQDLKEYSERRDKSRRAILDSLFDKVSEAGNYNSNYTGDER